MFLFEEIEVMKKYGMYRELPAYVCDGLSGSFDIRDYQKAALRNFITYFETDELRKAPAQVLFHMATGSGKTLVMAGLILYLYKKGYRNFIFFVNLDNIITKTKDNFLNSESPKYLFAKEIKIEGEKVVVREAANFQYADDGASNICFTTIQGLHSDIWFAKENALTLDDFRNQKTVLISDEAHHLNSDTGKGRKGAETDNSKSWEYTVGRILEANKENILLEFTATCDLSNDYIKAEYKRKIVFDYPLSKFREEGFSKEVKTLQADTSLIDRALQAVMLSQYRLKVFQDNRLFIKPVILFKAAKIQDSKVFMKLFIDTIQKLEGGTLERIASKMRHMDLERMYRYFEVNGITFDRLAQEIREEFGADRCISVNDDGEAEERQLIVNTLESHDNQYRAVFEVKKLDEGWDVLNLFDIVRLYETRDAKNGKPGRTTIAEAQLIGRGARYCPFSLPDKPDKYRRKYDNDLDNPLRVCEELYYHCQYDSRYIAELTAALKETGIMPGSETEVCYKLKPRFMSEALYTNGVVFINKKTPIGSRAGRKILEETIGAEYSVSVSSGKISVGSVMEGRHIDASVKTHFQNATIRDIADMNYGIVARALRRHGVFEFSKLRGMFPGLRSMREFVMSGDYLGGVRIIIESRERKLSASLCYEACVYVITRIAEHLMASWEEYEGSAEFYAIPLRELISDKCVAYQDPSGEGAGISQNSISVRPDWRMNLAEENWFAYEDNFGTEEEKAFVAFFGKYVDKLQKKYEMVRLIRNERQIVIYSFDGGRRFEPDYLLYLREKTKNGYINHQVFIEPKGSHLIAKDGWKEEFLLALGGAARPLPVFADGEEYRIMGFPFFNRTERAGEFAKAMESLLT